VNAKDDDGSRALIHAYHGHHGDIVALLKQ